MSTLAQWAQQQAASDASRVEAEHSSSSTALSFAPREARTKRGAAQVPAESAKPPAAKREDVVQERVCGNCGRADVATKMCAACKEVSYCSRDCQREAWKGHKATCQRIAAARKTAGKKEASSTTTKPATETTRVKVVEIGASPAAPEAAREAAPAAKAQAQAQAQAPAPRISAHVPAEAPRSYAEFLRYWKQFRRAPDAFFEYFMLIPTGRLCALFGDQLDSDQLSTILNALRDFYAPNAELHARLAATLIELAQVKRLDMMLMFLSTDDKAALRTAFDAAASADGVDAGAVAAARAALLA